MRHEAAVGFALADSEIEILSHCMFFPLLYSVAAVLLGILVRR
jgi:hypothetical protein